MKQRLIITESQLDVIKRTLIENAHSDIVKQMKAELDANYVPTTKLAKKGGEYSEMPMIMIKVDEEIISPKAIFEYLKNKYKTGDDFTKQVIRDWMFGKISDDYRLSKNVTLS